MSESLTNADILRVMLENGERTEALAWLEQVSQHASPDELVQLQRMTLISNAKRKRGGAGHVRDGFADMVREQAFARSVQRLIDKSVGSLSIEDAVDEVARAGVPDPKSPAKRVYRSESSVRAYYLKWKKRVKLNESPFA